MGLSKDEFEFVNEYIENVNTYSPKEFKEMFDVKKINMDIFCQSHKNSILIDCTGKITPESAKTAGLIVLYPYTAKRRGALEPGD